MHDQISRVYVCKFLIPAFEKDDEVSLQKIFVTADPERTCKQVNMRPPVDEDLEQLNEGFTAEVNS